MCNTLLISESSSNSVFQHISSWFFDIAHVVAETPGIRRQLVLRDTSMRREPRSQQRSVLSTGVDVNGTVNVFAVAVNDIFALECVVLFERLIDETAPR